MPVIDFGEYQDSLAHYGTPRHSGRYPWGSGKTPFESAKSFSATVADLKDKGLSDTEIAKGFGTSTTELRALKSIARNEMRQDNIRQAQRLKDKGYSNVAIGQRMGLNESTVRSLLEPGAKDRADALSATSSQLRDMVAQKKYLDIGSGTENHLGVSKTRLDTAVAVLKKEGYGVHYVKVLQQGTGEFTNMKVLAAPGVEWKEVNANRAQIQTVGPTHSEDGGRTFNSRLGVQDPISIDPKRVAINYKEDGGANADGVIFVRPGVSDISMGTARYAQVRIKVGDGHYLKGMAVYKDDLPKGTDLVFNTNKSNTGNKLDAMKELKTNKETGEIDTDNPFGATVRQLTDSHDKVNSAMNIVNEEGDWSTWSKSLSAQMLSKQNPSLAERQLAMKYEQKRMDLDSIQKLTNPAVKQKLLESFADDADSSAVHLKAAALPRQASHVILPVASMKPTEVYAPNHRNGERVVLIRYPHAGTFEIPELVVNNRNPEAKALIGNSEKVDAIGIHHSVAEQLSGADFDGDSVLVIPNDHGDVKTSSPLAELKGFDPQSYKIPEGSSVKKITPARKQYEMGNVTNLISDMSIHGASSSELARAVKHSMVVIDSEKHGLDYKASARAYNIAQLKEKYQGSPKAGASTLITKAASEIRVPDRKPRPAAEGGPIDKATGKKVFVETGKVSYRGNLITKESKKLAETDDANTLSSGTRIEQIYADHSNRLKALANEARKDYVNVEPLLYSKSAKQVYAPQVERLNRALNTAKKNRPLERSAQLLAEATVNSKRAANPDMDAADLKKIRGQALTEARIRVGAKKELIDISPDEWDAIQAGAISHHKLSEILNNADLDKVKELATPRTQLLMTPTKKARAQAMIANGYTQDEIASALGVSVSTLKSSLKGE
jgi:DNA-directed RNA polymerase specialized sigma24 family protein